MYKYFWIIAAVLIVGYCGRGLFSSPTEKNEETTAMTAPTTALTSVPTSTQVSMPTSTSTLTTALVSVPTTTSTSMPTTIMPEPSQKKNNTVRNCNLSPELQFENEIMICIAYTEHFRSKAYKCCGQWLIGYGQARINGKLVRAGQSISELEAQQEIRRHLRKYVYPVVDGIDRPMTNGEYVTCCLLAYNMGTGGFKKSSFYKAFSSGKSQEECLKCLKGKGGVGKRRWVDAALFCGVIDPYDLLELAAGGCFNFSRDYLYTPNGVVDLSPEKVEKFLSSPLNQRGKKLRNILK